MPMRKLVVSFELDAELFAKMLLHSPMDIKAFGDEPEPVPRVTHTLRHTAGKQMAILEKLASQKRVSLTEISEVAVQAGFTKSVGSCLNTMLNTHVIQRVGSATYSITKKGLAYVKS